MKKICLFIIVTIVFIIPCAVIAGDYSIGVFYFPGWTNTPEAWWNPPWEKIKPYPEREPLLGFYPEGETWVAEKHIEWMHSYGIAFVIYDWYWRKEKGPHLEHALNAYLRSKNKDLVQFAILWANHTEVPDSLRQFETIVDHWIKRYFMERQYLKIDGKPVVFVFSPHKLRENASKLGRDVKDLLDLARAKAVQAGLKGIHFVAQAEAIEYWVKSYIPKNGFDAITAYNYHRGLSGKHEEGGLSANYEELTAGYRQNWDWILKNSPLPYFVPVTSGWNSRPWGSNTSHDNSVSTPESFKKHLDDAKRQCDKYPEKTMRTVVICCWNEFGEGSYIEPTKKWQFQYLEKVKTAFTH